MTTIKRDIAPSLQDLSTPTAEPLAALAAHKKAVESIATKIKHFYTHEQKFRINHGSTNSTRQVDKGRNLVDISSLSRVLEINTRDKTALVEPNVSMDRLIEATLPHGLIPPIVMEFPGITVGGGYAGTSGESSSFKHGFLDRTINHVEMVLADGEIITCSPDRHSDLFHGAAGAVGTLGVTTLIQLQLREAKAYVETTYHPVTSITAAISTIQTLMKDDSLDYLDGILFSPSSGAVITGRLTDMPPANAPTLRFSSAWDPWFYLHVRDSITRSPSVPTTYVIPLAEYLFRYDRGGFWVGASAFQYFGMPFNRFTRWFLDDFLHTRMMYTALHASGESQRYIVQDLALPFDKAEEFINYTHETFNIWPLWLCPLLTSPKPTFHPHQPFSSSSASTSATEPSSPQSSHSHLLNIGLWGYCPFPKSLRTAAQKQSHFLTLNRSLEHVLHALGGTKWLYAQTFYSSAEFWSVYGPRTWYDSLRAKYRARGLPDVYEKVGPRDDSAAQVDGAGGGTGTRGALPWPWGGLLGLWKAMWNTSWREARRARWRRLEIGEALEKGRSKEE